MEGNTRPIIDAPCPNFDRTTFTCTKGTDCTCVEGQHDDVVEFGGEGER